MNETVTVKGLAELKIKLDQLPAQIARKCLRHGVFKAAALIRDVAKANAPIGPARSGHTPGTLKRAAIVKFLRQDSNDQQAVYIVAFRKGSGQQKKSRDAFYASFVEFGHARRGGGQVPRHAFLTPAFETTASNALDVMISTIQLDLNKLPEFQ